MTVENVVKITVGGRITLPKDTREALGWEIGTKLIVVRDKDKLILQSVKGNE